MPDPVLQSALDGLESLLTGPEAPTDRPGLSRAITEALLAPPSASAAAPRVYVPDAEGPVAPADRDAQAGGPVPGFEAEVRALSSRARGAVLAFTALTAETQTRRAGLQAKLRAVAARQQSAKSLVSSGRLDWMRRMDRFLDLSGVDPTASTGVVVDAQGGGGVSLAPASETDLTPAIASLTLVPERSAGGLPGDNLELASLQDLPGQSSPAAGASTALSAARSAAGSTGGTGQEPTVSYAGVPDLHADLSVILSPSDAGYFDWERLFVPPIQPCLPQGAAYVADPTGSPVDVTTVTHGYGWTARVTEPDGTTRPAAPLALFQAPPASTAPPLTLSLEVDLGALQPLNQLEITVRQVGGLWPKVTAVTISADRQVWFDLRCQGGALTWTGESASAVQTLGVPGADGSGAAASGDGARGTSVWDVPTTAPLDTHGAAPTFRYLSLAFAQPAAYSCPKGIGHPFYVHVTQTRKSGSSLFGLSHTHSQSTTAQRLSSPDTLVNATLGVLSRSSGRLGGSLASVLGAASSLLPVSALGNTLGVLAGNGGISGVVTGLIGGLLGGHKSTTTLLQAGEYNDVFAAFRQVISLVQVKPLARAYATGSAQIVTAPLTFTQPAAAVRLLVDDHAPAGTSLRYEVSADAGQTWTAIVPSDLGTPPSPAQAAATTVTFPAPTRSVRVRATLSTTTTFATPRLLGYCLEALPAS